MMVFGATPSFAASVIISYSRCIVVALERNSLSQYFFPDGATTTVALFLYTSMVVSVYFRLMDVLFKDLKKSMSVESFIVLYCRHVFYTTHLHIFLGYLSLLVSMSSNHVVLTSLLDSDMH